MADELAADIELNFSESVDALESALNDVFDRATTSFGDSVTAAVDSVAAADIVVPVEADTADAMASVEEFAASADSLEPTASLDADASAATSAVDGWAAEADATTAEASLEVDTSGADAALESVSSSADDAGASLGGAQGAASGFSAVSDLATGSAAGLGSALGDTSKGAGLVVGAVTAGAAAVGVFFNEALDSEAVTRRFKQTLGEFADQVDNINVGNLSTDISSLAIQLGSSDEQMRRSATNAFLFATNSGIAGDKAAQFASSVEALAARAVALNPDLGDVGDAAQTLQRALVTGRERALLPFNLGLDKTQVATRAAALALEAGHSEVLGIDKAMAAAQLSVEKFGGSLDQDIARGAENPTIKLRSLKTELKEFIEGLGKPLVTPIFDLLRAGLPVAEAAGRVIAKLGGAAIPLVTAAAEGLVPILTLATDLLTAIPAPVLSSAAGFLLMAKATVNTRGGLGTLVPLLGAIVPLLSAIDPGLASSAVSVGSFAFAGSKLGTILPNVSTGMGAVAGAGIGLGQAIGGAAGNAVSFASAGALMGQALIPIPVVGALAGAAIGALGSGLLDSGESVEDYRARIEKLAGSLKGLSQAEASRAFIKSLGDTDRAILETGHSLDSFSGVTGKSQSKVRALSDEFRSLAAGSPTVARNVLQGLADTGKITADQFERLSGVVDRASAAYGTHAQNAAAVAAADQALTGAQNAAGASFDSFVSTAVGALPTADQALATTAQNLQGFGLSLTSSVSPEAFLAKLQETTAGIINFQANLQTAVSGGFSNVARFVSSQGPAVGGAYLQAFLAAPPAVQQATEAALAAQESASTGFQTFLTGPFAATIQGGYQTAFQKLPDLSAIGMAAAGVAVEQGAPGVASATTNAAATATSGFQAGVAPIPSIAGGAIASASAPIGSAAFALNGIARNAGHDVGFLFAHGLAEGIDDGAGGIASAARAAVHAAVVAAGNAGSPSEHLFYDVAEKWPLAMAQAIGDGQDLVTAASTAMTRAAATAPPPFAARTPAAAGGPAGDLNAIVDKITAALAASSGSTQIGPFHQHGADPQESAKETAREVAFQLRYAGV